MSRPNTDEKPMQHRLPTDGDIAPVGINALALLDMSPDFIAVIDEQARLHFASAGITRLLGHVPSDWTSQSIIAHVHPDDIGKSLERLTRVLQGEDVGPNSVRLAHADGRWIPVELVSRRITDDLGQARLVLSVRDIAERNDLLERLRWQASHDTLTGLLSWAGLREAFNAVSTTWECRSVVLARLDLNGFQRINEFLGPEFADRVLSAFAERLVESAQPHALVGRLGGDDFVIVTKLEADAIEEVFAIGASLERPYNIDGKLVNLGISVGVAVASLHDGVLIGLPEAESALHMAKRSHQRAILFTEKMRIEGNRKRRLEVELRDELDEHRAGSRQRLTLAYQPVVSATTRKIESFEALARWEPTDGLLVPPSEFVPIAEATGLIVALGRHLLRLALRTYGRWQATAEQLGATMPMLSVNVSALQLQESSFVDTVAQLLAANAVPASHLTIELTESHLMEKVSVATSRLQDLRDLGCSIAIDDFGTGYSSLQYLRDLPVDIVKIDRSFVAPLGFDTRSVGIVRAIVDLSKRLGFLVVAEGVETMSQADMLTGLGVDRLQGYFTSAAIHEDEAFLLIESQDLKMQPVLELLREQS